MPQKSPQRDPFAIAKEALRLVGEFSTPPTPEIYEVWYRYIEGADDAMLEQLNHAVNDAKSVSVDLLASLHQQFCVEGQETGASIGDALAAELSKLQTIVLKQKDAGSEFGDSIQQASDILKTEDQNRDRLIACVANLADGTVKMQRQLDDMAGKLDEAQRQVCHLQADLEASQRGMMTDHLTGVGNRRFFDSLIKKTVQTFDPDAGEIYLVLLDMDRFKQINDTHGHEGGDQVIRFVASELVSCRSDSSVARLGGDEFAVFVRTNNRDEILRYTEQIREHLGSQQLQLRNSGQVISGIRFSLGVSRLRSSDDEVTWYTRADNLLYQAKDLGRNRAVVEKFAATV
ncbi:MULTISPECIES: GGDEF domain-containing protein [Crateriforma]|uniref:diguanylate cyclase n=1 Tax=Crateriforma conspicua TaxID=2527996 RepID=A0A5C6FJE1_9PLAN|nr:MULTISPECIES: GGDEF domain-containing protein [Crateriforma]TWU60930.1 Response regulator PleD [Crateriforma conspicua]